MHWKQTSSRNTLEAIQWCKCAGSRLVKEVHQRWGTDFLRKHSQHCIITGEEFFLFLINLLWVTAVAHSVTTHHHDDDYWFLTDKDFWEGWWSVLARSLVAVESVDVHTILHFVPMKVWAEDDWDAAHFFCLLRPSYTPSLLQQTCAIKSALWLPF